MKGTNMRSHSNPHAERQLALLAKSELLEQHKRAIVAAKEAAAIENAKLGPEQTRGFDCGFAWAHAPDVRGNTKLGKQLMALGYHKYHPTGLTLWKPARSPTQSISVHLAGARAYVEAMKPSNIRFVVGSRYD